MTAWTARTASPFGRALTAVVTPMHDDGSLDLAGAAEGGRPPRRHRARRASSSAGPPASRATTTDEEQDQIAPGRPRGGRSTAAAWWPASARNDTAHTVHLAKQAAAGRRPRPPRRHAVLQPAAAARARSRTSPAVADATGLPVMLYDIPARTGTPIATETLLRLADHAAHRRRQGRQGRPVVRRRRCSTRPTCSGSPATTSLTLAHLTQGADRLRRRRHPRRRRGVCGDARRRRRRRPGHRRAACTAGSSRSSTRS